MTLLLFLREGAQALPRDLQRFLMQAQKGLHHIVQSKSLQLLMKRLATLDGNPLKVSEPLRLRTICLILFELGN
jgi:hypothetical protein